MPASGQPYWQVTGGRRLTPAPFLIAGIVNVTPDSFSDGGAFADPRQALGRVRQVVAEGAHMVDLGAESTRPGADDIGHAEEWRRLAPVLEGALALRAAAPGNALPPGGAAVGEPPFAVAVDTFRAATAKAALECRADSGCLPVDVINDVSGGFFDPAMAEVLAAYKPGYVLGHSPAMPRAMRSRACYTDVVEEVLAWFSSRMDALVRAGLPEGCIVLDPCIGFGKKPEHDLALIGAVPRLASLGRPLYFGVSRKSFIGSLTGQGVRERACSTQVITALLARAGVAAHRVHDVADTVATLQIIAALRQTNHRNTREA